MPLQIINHLYTKITKYATVFIFTEISFKIKQMSFLKHFY